MPNTTVTSRPSICSTLTVLPYPLARTALAWAGDGDGLPADIRDLRCTLEHHTTGQHFSMVNGVADNTAMWTRWSDDRGPENLLVLPDCTATHPEHGGCCEYQDHPGGHTWQIHDPWNPTHEPASAAATA